MACSKSEFASIMAFLESATGAPPTPPERVAVYFKLLSDLPAKIIQAAAQQAVLEHKFPNLPPVGVIRSKAIALQSPPAIPGPEAWQLFLAAMRKYSCGRVTKVINGQRVDVDLSEKGLASLPPQVAHAARCFGWQRLCDTSAEHMGIAERDFLQSYGTLEKRDEQQAIMPPSVRAIAATIEGNFLPEQPARGPRELAAWVKDKRQESIP